MNDNLGVFEGTISGYRTIGGRKVVAVTIEAPIEHQAEIARIAEHGAWVAVARLHANKTPAAEPKERRRWDQMSVAERAGIRCGERAFWEYLSFVRPSFPAPENAEGAAKLLRYHFEVESRKDIKPDDWEKFDHEYQLWLRA
jgi:hypothetical protein